jgi:hypothetical protein
VWKTRICGVLMLASGAVVAQQPGAGPGKAASDLEPAVNTSAPAPARAPGPASGVTDTVAAKAPGSPPAARAATKPAVAAARPAVKPAGRSMDRLQLESTQITGNRELPKVMYVVPWRRADLGDLMVRPANSLLDEALTPVDRDVFRRQSQYYEALQPDQTDRAPAALK